MTERMLSPTPYSQETTKVAELKDQFGQTRFKIVLTDYDDEASENDDLRGFDRFFQVTAISFCFGKAYDNPITLSEEVFTNIQSAYHRFYELVEQYKHLMNVESKGWQDITVYADKIGYHKIDPDCCANCIYAKRVTPKNCPPQELKKHKGRFVCMNPHIAKEVSDFETFDFKQHDNSYDYAEPRAHFKFDLAPYTQEDGICNDYVRVLPGQRHEDRCPHRADEGIYGPPCVPEKAADCHCDDKDDFWPHKRPRGYAKNLHDKNYIEHVAKYEVNQKFNSEIDDNLVPRIEDGVKKSLYDDPPIIDGNGINGAFAQSK